MNKKISQVTSEEIKSVREEQTTSPAENKTKYVSQLSLQDFIEFFKQFGMKYGNNQDCQIIKNADGTFNCCKIDCDDFRITIYDDFNNRVMMFDNDKYYNLRSIQYSDIYRAADFLSLSQKQLISVAFFAFLMDKFPGYEQDWNNQFENNLIPVFSKTNNGNIPTLPNFETIKEFANMFNQYKVDNIDRTERSELPVEQLTEIASRSNDYLNAIQPHSEQENRLKTSLEKFGTPFISRKSTDKYDYIEIECDDMAFRIFNAFNFNLSSFDYYEGDRRTPPHEITLAQLDDICNSLGVSRSQFISSVLASYFSKEFPEYKADWQTLLKNGYIEQCPGIIDKESFSHFPNNQKMIDIARKINKSYVDEYENDKSAQNNKQKI